MTPTLLLHGGLHSKKSYARDYDSCQTSMRIIAERGYAYLQSHSAAETVVYVASLLEDDPLYNAGTGSTIQSDGVIRMSASLMDGHLRRFSGVINIENIKNPIHMAQALQNEKDRVLAGPQALAYAREKLKLPPHNPETNQRRKSFEEKEPMGTIGCVALDVQGKLAAATSTGGKGHEIPGRVSDSATVAGNFANAACALSATGTGEDIMNVALAAAFCTRVESGLSLNQASQKALAELNSLQASAAFIAIDANGNLTADATSPYLVWASIDADGIKLFGKN